MNGRHIGPYRIEEEAGTGGVATVYRAVDARSGGVVALKVLHPQFAAEPAVRRRFLREGNTARMIDSPHVVKCLDAGEDGETVYLAFEWMGTRTLRQALVPGQPLPEREVGGVTMAIARALHDAHTRGIVHRDVKPENILCTPDGTLKLTDFGAARTVDAATTSGSSLVWGTPQYMAPEVFTHGRVDPRSDLFSLGVIVFEMATGHLPWMDDAPLMRLTRPAGGNLRDLHEAGGWHDLVDALLDPDPRKRVSSAEELVTALSTGTLPSAPSQQFCLSCGAPQAEMLPLCLTCGAEQMDLQHTRSGDYLLRMAEDCADVRKVEATQVLLEVLTGIRPLPLRFLVGDVRLYSKSDREQGIGRGTVLFHSLSGSTASKLVSIFARYGVAVEAVKSGGLWDGFKDPPGGALRLRLRAQHAPMPHSDGLLRQVALAVKHLHAPEVRELVADVAAELFLLSRRAEHLMQTESGSFETSVVQTVLRKSTELVGHLVEQAKRLDELDAVLSRDTDADVMRAMQRVHRQGELADSTPAEWTQALQLRDAAEEERVRLASSLCHALSHARALVVTAANLSTANEQQHQELANAMEELERCMAGGG